MKAATKVHTTTNGNDQMGYVAHDITAHVGLPF